MKIQRVTDKAFAAYGKVLEGLETEGLLAALQTLAMPDGVAYEPSVPILEDLPVRADLQDRIFGGMPIQMGACWGHNTRLDCLEYHRDSEVNIGTHDFILLLAPECKIENGRIDSANVEAFLVPAGVAVEVYATALHYAPCHTNAADGFRVAVVLPKGTNAEKPDITPKSAEDKLLWARNKWLLAHADSAEAQNGAPIGITGPNIDIANEL